MNSTLDELVEALAEEVGINATVRRPLVEEALLAAALASEEGALEFEHLSRFALSKGLLCPWDHKLHRSKECDTLFADFQAREHGLLA